MNLYVYDAKKMKTELVRLENNELLEDVGGEFWNEDNIRKVWHAGKEEWYLSVFDVVKALTESKDPKQYIKKMRTRDTELGSKWGTICTPLQMLAPDGKMPESIIRNSMRHLQIY